MSFYSPKNSKEDDDESYIAISQIIAQDPRAHHEERGKQSHHHSFYEITFCRTRVSFSVQLDETTTEERENRYYVLIINVLEDKGDLKAVKGNYPYQVAQSSIK
jgi:hypothetical protein